MIIKECLNCGKEYNSYNYLKSKFCSRDCYWKNKKGMEAFHSSGGKYINSQGYVLVWSPKHKNRDCRGYVREHILVMEEKIGRNLKEEEVIHHKDKDKKNNEICNLLLCKDIKEHMMFHLKLSFDEIREIQRLFKSGYTKVLLSKMYNVQRSTIANYINNIDVDYLENKT